MFRCDGGEEDEAPSQSVLRSLRWWCVGEMGVGGGGLGMVESWVGVVGEEEEEASSSQESEGWVCLDLEAEFLDLEGEMVRCLREESSLVDLEVVAAMACR